MAKEDYLAQKFQATRPHLRAVAYRMLGSLPEAEDAVQEAWIRLNGSDADAIDNLGGWLTTVVARVCLDILRSRKSRKEESLEEQSPDLMPGEEDRKDPEQETLLGESVGLALLVVLETLAPQERLAFVLHDMFAMPFDEIASIVKCSPVAARQLASRARRKVRGVAPPPAADLHRQRKVVDAFLDAVRRGDFAALLDVLDPQIVLHAEQNDGTFSEIRGANTVAQQALMFSRLAEFVEPVLVNGAPGIRSWLPGGQLFSVMRFTVRNGRIVEIDVRRNNDLNQRDIRVRRD